MAVVPVISHRKVSEPGDDVRFPPAGPLDHSVCKVEYCELQRWREIIDLYQGMPNVQVLALVTESARAHSSYSS